MELHNEKMETITDPAIIVAVEDYFSAKKSLEEAKMADLSAEENLAAVMREHKAVHISVEGHVLALEYIEPKTRVKHKKPKSNRY
jgi:hypothetical protein